ncbi:MAG: AI-2E family transporter, partial [Ornithinimicrobium sp.]
MHQTRPVRTRALRRRVSGPSASNPTITPQSAHESAPSNPTVMTGAAVTVAARWTLRVLVLLVGLIALLWAVSSLWSIMLPLLLAILLATVLGPVCRLLARRLPHAIAASLTMAGLLAALAAIVAFLAPNVQRQGTVMLDQAPAYLTRIEDMLAGPPFDMGPGALSTLWANTIESLQQDSSQLMATLVNGVAGLGSFAITTVLTLVLTFFMIKDADRFTPWLTSWTGTLAGPHARVLTSRIWKALSSFIHAQATVGFLDALFIGIGLWLLDVPFALTLSVLIFFAAFVPIVGAFATGFLAVFIALIAQGPGVAVAVFLLILIVQQLEMNLTQPFLLGHALSLHPAAVLGSITVGGTLFGIIGALLAVPALCVVTVSARYAREISTQSADEPPTDDAATHASSL